MYEIALVKRSTDLKDIDAGWHKWQGRVWCTACSHYRPATLHGTYENARAYQGMCDRCLEERHNHEKETK